MYAVEQDAIDIKGKQLFIAMAIFRYMLGIAIAYWGSKIFSTLGEVYRQGMSDNFTGINCLRCPMLLKQSATALIIFGIFLIIMWLIDKTKDYLPAGIIWIFSGIFFIFPTLQTHKSTVLGIYFLLLIWWFIARVKEPSKLLGYIQIFMPLTLIGAIFTDDTSVWLFGVFLSISFEGVYLAIEGASELSFVILLGIEDKINYENAFSFLKDLMRTLTIQKTLLWLALLVVFVDVVGAFSQSHILKQITYYGYLLLAIAYFLSWWYMGIKLYKVHKSLAISVYIALSIILLSLFTKLIWGPFLAIIGILTGISIMSQIGPVYEMYIRKYAPAIMFDVYVDHISIAMLFILLTVILYSKDASTIMVNVAPFILISLGFIIKMLTLAFLLDTTITTLSNIQYAIERLREGKS